MVRKSSREIWITLLPPFSLYALHTAASFHRHQITQQHHNDQHRLICTNNRDIFSRTGNRKNWSLPSFLHLTFFIVTPPF